MTSRREFESPISLGLLRVPQPFVRSHLGIEYAGEVIIADRWRDEWGAPLQGAIYFRIVFLKSRQSLPRDAIQDARIAVCVPGESPGRYQRDIDREMGTLRETHAQYGATGDPRREVVRKALERREEEMQDRLEVAEAKRYREGQIHSPAGSPSLSPDEVFKEGHPEAWCDTIAGGLLSWVYPKLPLDSSLLPRTLKVEDASRVLAALLGQAGADKQLLVELGPALGLSSPENPENFDPADCAVFQRIRDQLDRAGGRLPWDEVHRALSHADGLTSPFAAMYLLAFAFHGQPEVELGLRSGHGLKLEDGRPLRSDRVVREVLPLVAWPDDVTGIIENLRLPEPVSWNGALPYTSLIAPELREVGEEEDSGAEEEVLKRALTSLSARLDRCEGVVGEVSKLSTKPDDEAASATIQRLRSLCNSQSFDEVYQQARSNLGSPQALSEDLGVLGRIEVLEEFLPELRQAVRYLDGAVIKAGYEELALVRGALISQFSLPYLLDRGLSPESLIAQFKRFRDDYSRAYRVHHRLYHSKSVALRARLEDEAARLGALNHLNSISELGDPLGRELEEQHNSLKEAVKSCDLNSQDLPLDDDPQCSSCSLFLGEVLPTQDVELFQRRVGGSLLEQNRRLSLVLVDRIVHGQANRRLEDFLKIVQASDLASLTNTLNDEMVLFIRRLVAGR